MHLFVYEYLSSGAAPDAADRPSLQTEGWAMLSAVLEDLSRCPGVQISTLLDSKRPSPGYLSERIVFERVQPAGESDAFRALAAAADWSLVIAPEFDDILAERSRWVEEAGGRLLGSSPNAIEQTADKLLLSRLWAEQGVPTPELINPLELAARTPSPLVGEGWGGGGESAFTPHPSPPPQGGREQEGPPPQGEREKGRSLFVCKPRFGAGSQATFLVHDEEELERTRSQAHAEGWNGELMLQRYVPGLAVSVAFLSSEGRRLSLPAVEQRLSSDGRFRYLGGRLPLSDNRDRRARRLAERAASCVEGLHGWFGVDLVLGDAEDGSGDVAIEINPRLTTSFLGLRRLACFNLAEALLAVPLGSRMPSWDWRNDSILFEADGLAHGSPGG